MNDTVDVAANLARRCAPGSSRRRPEAGRDPAAVTLIAGRQGAAVEERLERRSKRASASSARTTCRRRRPLAGAPRPLLRRRAPFDRGAPDQQGEGRRGPLRRRPDRRPAAARPALEKEMKKQGKALRCFVQVNTGKEPQKAGIMPEGDGGFVRICRESHGLDVQGPWRSAGRRGHRHARGLPRPARQVRTASARSASA